ncbi:hypothetical protein ACNI65_06710 [Roseateles sp. So40a]|uniref:hypothetical protein n=1 Tax=Roseateles sp. So40a TaxID=3400226 RepID=UPI003A8BC21F
MIAALNNTTTLNGPGATTGQSARVREAGVDDPSTASQAEASAVVSLSAQAASLAVAGGASSSAGAQTATGPSAAVQTATAQPVTAAPAAQAASTQTITTAAAPAAAPAPAAAAPAPAAAAAAAPAPAPAPAPTPAVAAQTTSFQPSNARAAATGEKQEFPPTVSLVPNLVYAEADSDQNGVVSPSERRAYDIVHPKLGERPADVPPKRVVDAELREYTSIANNRF